MSTVYIMRHGEAVARAKSDAERPLSEQGVKEAESMAVELLPNPPLLIWVSPYLRAQQTRDVVVAGLKNKGHYPEVLTVPVITPDDRPQVILDMLGSVQESPILLVSHNPLVSVLLSVLTEGHTQASIGMATASIACLNGEVIAPGAMMLDWYKSPLF